MQTFLIDFVQKSKIRLLLPYAGGSYFFALLQKSNQKV